MGNTRKLLVKCTQKRIYLVCDLERIQPLLVKSSVILVKGRTAFKDSK